VAKKETGRERKSRVRAVGDRGEGAPAEGRLRGPEEHWRSLVENIPDIVMTVDADGTILFINHTVPGLKIERVVGTSIYGYLPPEHHDTLRKVLGRVFQSGDACGCEIAGAGPFGRTSWYLGRIGPIMREGSVVAATLIASDITERKRAEEALRESEERYRRLVENINEAIYELDRGGRMTYISPAVEEVGGYSPSEIVGRPFADFLHPDDLSRAVEGFQGAVSGRPRPNEYRVVTKRGEVRWVRSFGRPILEGRRVVGVRGVLTDITEHKGAEEALRGSEERYRRLVENINEAICEVDAGGRITYISPAVEEVSGYTPTEVVGRSFTEFMHPDDVAPAMERFRRSVAGDHRPAEARVLSKSGEVHWARAFGRPILEGDRVVGFRGVLTDVTERKVAEEALRESEERYRRLVELSPYAIAVHSGEKMLFVNRAGAELLGAADAEEITGRPIWDFVHPVYVKTVRKRIQRVWPEGKKVDLVEEKLVRLDGQAIDVEMAAIPITYQGEPARQVILRDISERKRIEQALQNARDELESAVERQMQRGSAYGLTFRELTVLHLMADGRSDREIGTVLGISTLTAHKHVGGILTKMGVGSRTEASVRAVREGLLG
jgi:PAS domain S-box-containing protein